MRFLALMVALLVPAGAWAVGATAPVVAPVPGWVQALTAPAPVVRDPNRSMQDVLRNEQVRVVPGGNDFYFNDVLRIQTSQGLSDFGTVQLEWNPDTERPVVHRLLIIRDGKTIDVLASGQTFTVLRRENNLERAMLDGTLTAVIAPEGLQVGDMIDFAYTIEHRDPVMAGHVETLFLSPMASHPARLFLREIWPAGKTMQWRVTEGLDKPGVTTGPDGGQLVLDMKNVDPPMTPRLAPARFGDVGQLEVTDFASWHEVAALFAPLYVKSATLQPGSPLIAEAARIRAAAKDPKQQAALALQLVQDKIRYVFLGMDQGGYVPAAADRTWARRFGDCKGKTVLLLALLHELGLDAVPALVSVDDGDGLDQRVPTTGHFDHVMVRLSLGGKVYWLDGTRIGDRNLDDIAVPPFKWALPLSGTIEGLQALPSAPPVQPLVETTLSVDISAGIFTPIKVHGKMTLRGNAALSLREDIGDYSRERLEARMRDRWRSYFDFIDPQRIDFAYDDTAGVGRVTMDGTARLDWFRDQGIAGRHVRLGESQLSYEGDFARDPGPHRDAPFAVRFPVFETLDETILLPNRGAGFWFEGADIDRSIGGREWHRATRIEGDKFVMHTSERTLSDEMPASQAAATAAAMHDLAYDAVHLHTPVGYHWSVQDLAKRNEQTPEDASAYFERGWWRHIYGNDEGAITDLSECTKRDPKWPTAFAELALIYANKLNLDLYTTNITIAERLDPKEPIIYDARAALAVRQHRLPEAIDAYTQELALAPNEKRVLRARAEQYAKLNNYEKSIADYNDLVLSSPSEPAYYLGRWQDLIAQKKEKLALVESEGLVVKLPDLASVHRIRGYVLGLAGQHDEAVKEYDRAIALSPAAVEYVYRALAREPTDIKGKQSDIDLALKADPAYLPALLERGAIDLMTHDYAAATDAYAAAVRTSPGGTSALNARAHAYAAMQRLDLAMADMDQLVQQHPGDPEWLNNRCWMKATHNLDLISAQADCAAALRIGPDYAEALDSMGFVLLRLGKFAEAKSSYDAALRVRPNEPSSLLGRAIAEQHAGDTTAAQNDRAAAKALRSSVETEFAGYGVAL